MRSKLMSEDAIHNGEFVSQTMVQFIYHQAPVLFLLVEPSNDASVMLGRPDDQTRRKAVEAEVADLTAEHRSRRSKKKDRKTAKLRFLR